MKTKSLIILALAFIACFSSCKKAPLSVGKTVTQTRELPYFHEVSLNDDISLSLVRSDTCYIEITAGENIIDNITTNVNGSTLTIRNTNTLDFIRTFDYEIHATLYYKNISDFIYASTGDVDSRNQYNINDDAYRIYRFEIAGGSGNVNLIVNDCNYFYLVYQHGTADVNLRGSNNRFLRVFKRSYGNFNARNFKAQKVDIMSNSTGDCYIWATDTINAEIINLGDIYYKGNPSAISCDYGENARGRLLPLN